MMDAPRRSTRRNSGRGRDKFAVGDVDEVSDRQSICVSPPDDQNEF